MEARVLQINDYKSLLLNQINAALDKNDYSGYFATDGVRKAINKFKSFVDRKEYWSDYNKYITEDKYRHYVPYDKLFDLTFKLMKNFFSLRQSVEFIEDRYFLDLPNPTGQFKVYTYIDYGRVYHGKVQEGYYTTLNTAVQYDSYTQQVPIEFILKDKFGKIIESYDSPHFIFATPDEANASGFLYSVAFYLQDEMNIETEIMNKKKEANKNGNKQETAEA